MSLRIYNLSITPSPPETVPPRDPLCFYRGPLHLKPQLAPKVDFRNKLPPCFDQGRLGSCTANALCGAVVYVIPSLIGSRLFLYYNERKIERTIPTDSGAYIHDGITALKTYGICLETQWPYNIAKFAVAPTAQCYTSAAQHKALTVASVPINLGSMKAVLAGGFPITIGFTVYDSFETAAVARTGIVPMPAKSERVLGGHAVLIVGFDDSRSWFIVRNSWGTGWGDKGYFYIPYAYFTNPTLVSDLWTISRVQA